MATILRPNVPIQSTAGAVPMKNEKGDLVMQKVKVSRYVTGKRPDYAPESSSEEEEEVNFSIGQKSAMDADDEPEESSIHDRRLRRLQERRRAEEEEEEDSEAEDRVARHRREVIEPEVIAEASDDEVDRRRLRDDEESSEEEEVLDEEEIERRRALLRQRALQRREEEVMDVEEEKSEGESEEESSEYEEYSDSEEETGPRLKPVFVRKKDRITIQEKEKEESKLKELEAETKRLADMRRGQTLKMVEAEARKDLEEAQGPRDAWNAVESGDENDEEEYEGWKVRELRRMKRDREEREALEKEKQEIERIRNMTEEERRNEQRLNPREIVNKAPKGKYKFLQKYYHRGAFFLDEEDKVFTQDFSAPTLEDHFDKTILPKVMQVKNFGRSGRTKYTHLIDQDTTENDSPWISESAQNLKFHSMRGGGMKETFERPSVKKRK